MYRFFSMTDSDAIVNPTKPRNAPEMGPVAVMAATQVDLFDLCDLFGFNRDDYRRLFISRLYMEPSDSGISLTGPFIGAPYAAMLLETLIARGVNKVIFVGWCGAVSQDVKIGDIIVPTRAVIDEGTSPHYAAGGEVSPPTTEMTVAIQRALKRQCLDFHPGPIWSTDAVYRETRKKVKSHQQNGVLAVEMEVSALWSVARFRGADVGAILVVSDELSTGSWQPGFKREAFIQARRDVCRVIREVV